MKNLNLPNYPPKLDDDIYLFILELLKNIQSDLKK
jgi:hypothetical protein